MCPDSPLVTNHEQLNELVTQAQTTFAAYINTETRSRIENFKNAIGKQAEESMRKRLQREFSDISSLDAAQATYASLLTAIKREDTLTEVFCEHFRTVTECLTKNRFYCDGKGVELLDRLEFTMRGSYAAAKKTAISNFKEKLNDFFKAIFTDTENKIREARVSHIVEPTSTPRQIFHSDLNNIREVDIREKKIRISILEKEQELLQEFRTKTSQCLRLIPGEFQPEMEKTIAAAESKMIALIETRKKQTPHPLGFFDKIQKKMTEKMTELDAATFKI